MLDDLGVWAYPTSSNSPDMVNCPKMLKERYMMGCSKVLDSYVCSNLVGYQTSNIRLLWTITPNPPPPPQHPF